MAKKTTDIFKGLPQPKQPAEFADPALDNVDAILGRPLELPPMPHRPPDYKPRILFIDDEVELLNSCMDIYTSSELKNYAELEAFHFTPNGERKLVQRLRRSIAEHKPFDTIYVDRQMEGAGVEAGLGLIERLLNDLPQLKYTPFVIVTAYPDEDMAKRAREIGVIRVIIKTIPAARQGVFGSLVHRLIMEARETREQAEDQVWTDVNLHVSELLGRKAGSLQAAESMINFLAQHFTLKAAYVRRWDPRGGRLELIAGRDNLEINQPRLPVGGIPALKALVSASNAQHYVVINRLDASHLGPTYDARLSGYRAVAAQIRAGDELLGLLTIYRAPEEREFRDRDAHGLHHLACQLAAAMISERQIERAATLQRETITTVQQLDQAEDETTVYETLQRALFDLINITHAGEDRLKVSLRRIVPGSSDTQRAVGMRGFRGDRKPERISLEDEDGSSIARAVASGELVYCPDVQDPKERPHFMLVSDKIRTSLAVPLISRGICVGAACLESLEIDAFGEDIKNTARLLCECAADSLIRLRTKRFMMGVSQLFGNVTSENGPTAADIIPRFVALLFELTGASELQYITSENGPWTPAMAFVYPGSEMPAAKFEEWKRHLEQNWTDSYVYQVIYGPEAEWTHTQSDIVSDRELRDGRETKTQAVLRVERDSDSPIEAAFALYFVHRHAMNDTLLGLLAEMVHSLAKLLDERRRVDTIVGLNSIREQEARLGQIYGQVRHRLRAPLATIGALLDLTESGAMPMADTFGQIREELRDLASEIDRNKALIKAPDFQLIALQPVWDKVRNNLLAQATRAGSTIHVAPPSLGEVYTDQDILENILFNLIDNALRHGGNGIEVSVERRADHGQFCVLVVTDTGAGFPDSVRKSFGTPGTSSEASSTGMGVYLSRSRAADLQGELSLMGSEKGRTRLQLKLLRHQ